ncbi:coiled-coil domain-containing protein 14-like isoform X2 [Dendronephthya gigantea]|nr:coiled-coil domain-containing protein 14-like isoform X2 [Dendronephthya gigantea]
MSRAKKEIIGKPSKASLKSRGLSTSNKKTSRKQSIDTGYSLYSTDSENVSEVNTGLDKCAELLTNILEIKSARAKEMKKSVSHHADRPLQQRPTMPRSRKTKPAPTSLKLASTNQKPNKSIHIPTAKIPGSVQKPRTAYNERVVASTPVLTTEQRKHLQDLQKKEHDLQQQIQLLQDEYNNLEEHSVAERSPPSGKHVQDAIFHSINRERQEPSSSRRSLDFSNHAEKPFVENQVQVVNESSATASVDDSVSCEKPAEHEKTRRVQFVPGITTPHEPKTDSKFQELNSKTKIENEVEMTNKSPSYPEDQNMTTNGKVSKAYNLGSQKQARPPSPQRYSDHLRILAYLFGELRAILASSDDKEVDRLIIEIESEIRLLTSYTVHSLRPSPGEKAIKKQYDIDTEIALQPLRSENSDLRRKLRIAHQKSKDLEEQLQKGVGKRKEDFADFSDESVIEHLHKQLFLERENVRQMKHRNEQAEKIIAQQKNENSQLQDIIAEKDEELDTMHDELSSYKTKYSTGSSADSHSKRQIESMELKIRAKNKEVDLLKLAIEQRDAEIERLTELTRGLQQSLTRVLTNVQDLHPEDVTPNDVSMLSGIDSWRPTTMTTLEPPKAMPSVVSTAPRVHLHHLHEAIALSEKELDLASLQTGNREYDNISSPVSRMESSKEIIDSVVNDNDDDTTISVSSTDEFVFKQELANLDTMIARLQDSLRKK